MQIIKTLALITALIIGLLTCLNGQPYTQGQYKLKAYVTDPEGNRIEDPGFFFPPIEYYFDENNITVCFDNLHSKKVISNTGDELPYLVINNTKYAQGDLTVLLQNNMVETMANDSVMSRHSTVKEASYNSWACTEYTLKEPDGTNIQLYFTDQIVLPEKAYVKLHGSMYRGAFVGLKITHPDNPLMSMECQLTEFVSEVKDKKIFLIDTTGMMRIDISTVFDLDNIDAKYDPAERSESGVLIHMLYDNNLLGIDSTIKTSLIQYPGKLTPVGLIFYLDFSAFEDAYSNAVLRLKELNFITEDVYGKAVQIINKYNLEKYDINTLLGLLLIEEMTQDASNREIIVRNMEKLNLRYKESAQMKDPFLNGQVTLKDFVLSLENTVPVKPEDNRIEKEEIASLLQSLVKLCFPPDYQVNIYYTGDQNNLITLTDGRYNYYLWKEYLYNETDSDSLTINSKNYYILINILNEIACNHNLNTSFHFNNLYRDIFASRYGMGLEFFPAIPELRHLTEAYFVYSGNNELHIPINEDLFETFNLNTLVLTLAQRLISCNTIGLSRSDYISFITKNKDAFDIPTDELNNIAERVYTVTDHDLNYIDLFETLNGVFYRPYCFFPEIEGPGDMKFKDMFPELYEFLNKKVNFMISKKGNKIIIKDGQHLETITAPFCQVKPVLQYVNKKLQGKEKQIYTIEESDMPYSIGILYLNKIQKQLIEDYFKIELKLL